MELIFDSYTLSQWTLPTMVRSFRSFRYIPHIFVNDPSNSFLR